MNKILVLTLLLALVNPLLSKTVDASTLYDQFKDDFEITDSEQNRSVFKDKKTKQILTVQYNKKGQPYRMEATQDGKTSEVREFSSGGIKRQEFLPHKTKWESRYEGDRIHVYKDSKKIGDISMRDAFSYDVPACIDDTQVQPIIEQLRRSSSVLPGLVRRLASGIEIESSCDATGLSEEVLRARMEDALRNGVSCLLQHGRESRLDAARLLSVFQSRRPFKIYCRGEDEPFIDSLNNVGRSQAHMGGDAFAIPCGSDHYPGMVLNSSTRMGTSPATLFHEAMHELGYHHAGGDLDITSLVEACCFDQETYAVAAEARRTACSLIERRPAPDSPEYIRGMIQVMTTPIRSSRGSAVTGAYVGQYVVDHAVRLVETSENAEQRRSRSLLLRDALIQLTSRAQALGRNYDDGTAYYQYSFYAYTILPTLSEQERAPLLQGVMNRSNISQNAKNVLQIFGRMYAYIYELRNSRRRASESQTGVLITDLRQAIGQIACTTESGRAEAQALNRFVANIEGPIGGFIRELYQPGACP